MPNEIHPVPFQDKPDEHPLLHRVLGAAPREGLPGGRARRVERHHQGRCSTAHQAIM